MLPRSTRWSPPPLGEGTGRRVVPSDVSAGCRRPSRTPSPVPARETAKAVCSQGHMTSSQSRARSFGTDVTNTHQRVRTPPAKVARVERSVTQSSLSYATPQTYLCYPPQISDLTRGLEEAQRSGRRGDASPDSLESVSPITALCDEETDGVLSCTSFRPEHADDLPATHAQRVDRLVWPFAALDDDEAALSAAPVPMPLHLTDIVSDEALHRLRGSFLSEQEEWEAMGYQPSF